jgi:hypothetical protein
MLQPGALPELPRTTHDNDPGLARQFLESEIPAEKAHLWLLFKMGEEAARVQDPLQVQRVSFNNVHGVANYNGLNVASISTPAFSLTALLAA